MPTSKTKPTLIMLSAMYENGGNTTHRFLDGHPELAVYPFESQLGTKYVDDYLSSIYPSKYRWPIIPNSLSAGQIYDAIIDEEFKVRVKTPQVSKFRDKPFAVTDQARKTAFEKILGRQPLTRRKVIEAFFQSTFEVWHDHQPQAQKVTYVGYSPIIGIDAAHILADFPKDGAVIHVVRNPFSAYADTKKRPVPLSLEHYIFGWRTCQYFARLYAQKYPQSFFIVRYEDIVGNPEKTLGTLLGKLGISTAPSLAQPTWNGQPMENIFPWGTIRIPTPQANLATAEELTQKEIDEITVRTAEYLEFFSYTQLSQQLKK